MERTPVNSSNLASVGYNPATKILEIGFQDGSIWQYSAVPLEVHEELIAADSQGTYLATHVKGNYPFNKIK